MRARLLTLLVVMATALAAGAAPHPFYARLLQRGIASAQHGRNAEAARELKIAAFGLMADLPLYQTAQIYLAVVNERLSRAEEARMAAVKFLHAERLSPSYESLDLHAEIRASFEKIAASAADPEYLASLPAFRRSAPREISTVASKSATAVLPEPEPSGAADGSAAAVSPQTADTAAVSDVAARIREAQALSGTNRRAAIDAFAAIADTAGISRDDLLTAAAALNRLGAWQQSSTVFERALPWRDGDAQHLFLQAVNRYELGDAEAAAHLLARALPDLPPSRELAIYRGMIEAAARLP